MWFSLRRWPLIISAVVCIGFAIHLLDTNGAATAAAASLLVLGAVLLGAFLALYARDSHDETRGP